MSEAYDYAEEPTEALPEGADQQQAEPAKPAGLQKLLGFIQSPNIAEELDDSALAGIGTKVCEEFQIDVDSRKAEGYEERIESAVQLAKLAKEEKSYPWPKASNVKFPLIIQAAIQFNARSYAALIDGPNIVKGRVEGEPTPEKQDRAKRIGEHMSYQLLQEMEEWEEDTDQLLLRLPIVGTLVRKTYFDPILQRNCSHVIGPDQFVVNYRAKRDLSVCPRATQIIEFYPHEITEKMRAGFWLDVDLGRPQDASNDDQAPHTFLEQHRLLDLDEDDYPEPYVVTVHKETQKVVRIVARFYEDGITANGKGEVVAIKAVPYFAKYGFIPSPDGGFYDLGFGTLLEPMAKTINSTINQLMDAGHLANMQGGFIGEGVSIKSGNMRFQPGEWKKVSAAGGNLAQNIVPLPVKEPSAVLFQLLGMLIEASKDLTATQDILTGDAGKSNTPVGTTLALIEQGLKTFTAIVKRVHRALKRELEILYGLNGRYLDPQAYFTFQDTQQAIAQQDYAANDCDVVPVSDPNMATDMQRLGRAQFLMGFLGKGLNDQEIIKRVLEAAGIADVKGLMPQGPPPPDPKLAIESDKIDLKHREQDTKDALARSQIGVNEASAQKTLIEAFMAGPQFQGAIAQFIDQRVQEQLANGQAVHPGDVPGMAQQPPHPGLPAIPPGPAGLPQGPMGGGPGNGPPPPDQGPPDGGVGVPGMGGAG